MKLRAWLLVPVSALAFWAACSSSQSTSSNTPPTPAASAGGDVDAGVSSLTNDPDASLRKLDPAALPPPCHWLHAARLTPSLRLG